MKGESIASNCCPPGLSDPYVVVKFGGRVVFRSSVVKKSLNPDWRESATLTAPRTGELIRVVSLGPMIPCPCHLED